MIEFLFCAAVTKELLYHKIVEVSRDYGVSESAMMYVVEHESARDKDGNFLPCAIGDTHLKDPTGKPHRSRGIVQINEYFNTGVTDVEAFDINFSLWFLATEMQKGNLKKWTTGRWFLKKYPLADTT